MKGNKVPKQFYSISKRLSHIKEACNVLILHKDALLEEEVLRQTCSSLSMTQLHHLLTNFTPDSISPEKPSLEVKQFIQNKMKDSDELKIDSEEILPFEG